MEFEKLIQIKRKKIDFSSIVFTSKTRKWCQLPYKNNKKCPNYNSNPNCPPKCHFNKERLYSYNHFFLIYADFDFKKYCHLRREENKDNMEYWTEDRIKSLLYWQSSVINLLRNELSFIISSNPKNKIYLLCSGSGNYYKSLNLRQDNYLSMESAGIYVFGTLMNNGFQINIDFELKPRTKILLICLLCSDKDLKFSKQKKLIPKQL